MEHILTLIKTCEMNGGTFFKIPSLNNLSLKDALDLILQQDMHGQIKIFTPDFSPLIYSPNTLFFSEHKITQQIFKKLPQYLDYIVSFAQGISENDNGFFHLEIVLKGCGNIVIPY